MDEIVAHLVEELAMDGESGTDIERFLTFVQAFYDEQHVLDPTQPRPKVDGAYGDCVWHWLSRHGSVKLGLRKPKAAEETKDVKDTATTPKGKHKKLPGLAVSKIDTVEIFSDDVVHSQPLSAHARAHTTDLRIVVDEDIVRLKITGSSVKNLLAPAPYAALQLIARSRANALTATELGRTIGYDQKTVFYFVRRLMEAGLVAKFQAHETGTTSNLLLHRRYWSANETYVAQQTVALEGASAAGQGDVDADGDDDAAAAALAAADEPRATDVAPINDDGADEDVDDDFDDGEPGTTEPIASTSSSTAGNTLGKSAFHGTLAYPAMSRQRFLAFMNNATLVRSRICKLLLASENHIAAKARLYERMGFPTSTRSDRKFFLDTTRRAVLRGLIEPVQVQLENEKLIPCLRLTAAGIEETKAALAEPRDMRAQVQQARLELQLQMSEPRYRAAVTFERQLLEAMQASGEQGLTINEIARDFHSSLKAKRHIDEYMRSCESATAVNTPDFAIFSVIEMEGRERRVRFWTRPGILKKQLREESAQQALASQLATLQDYDASRLYETVVLPNEHHYSSLDEVQVTGTVSTRETSTKRPTAKSNKKYTNPVDPSTGMPRKGRPRKSDNAPPSAKALAKRKAGGDTTESPTVATKRRKGDTGPAAMAGSLQSPPSDVIPEAAQPAQDGTSQINAAPDNPVAAVESPTRTPAIKRRYSEALEPANSPDSKPSPAHTSKATSSTPRGKAVRASRATSSRVEFSAERRMVCFMEMLDEFDGILEDSYCGRAFERFIVPREGDNLETFLKEVGDLRETKTRRRVVDQLERRGQVKITSTVAPMKGPGRTLQKRVIYKPDVPAEKLAEFVRALMKGKEPIAPSDDGATTRSIARGPNIGQVSMGINHTDAGEVVNIIKTRPLQDLLEDPSTRTAFTEIPIARSQLYGLIPGSLARLQHVHVLILSHLDEYPEGEQGVVSKAAGVFDVTWLLEHAPLETFVKVRPVTNEAPELLAALQDDALKQQPISQQSYQIRAALDHTSESRTRTFFDAHYFHRMIAVGLAVPVEKTEGGDFSTIEYNGNWHSLCRFKLDRLADGHPFGNLDATTLPLHGAEDAKAIWKELKANRALYADRVNKAVDATGIDYLQLAYKRLSAALNLASSWFSHFQLVRRQQVFLHRFTQESLPYAKGNILDSPETIKKISDVSLVPTWVVERFIRRSMPRTSRPANSSSSLNRRAAALAEGGGDDGGGDEDETPQNSAVQATAQTQERKKRAKPREAPPAPAPDAVEEEETPTDVARAQVVSKIVTVQTRRQALWRLTFAHICSRVGAEGVTKLKLEDSLADVRNDYLAGRDNGMTPEMLGDMVSAIIAQDGAAARATPREKSRRTKQPKAEAKAPSDGGIRRRRKRTELTWTRERDELLRDACVILTARDRVRPGTRSNWIALNQLFPDINPQQLRQRFLKLASAVGEEAYLAQLEIEWTELWELLRGTALLPDRDYRRPDAFDLEGHVRFLRQYIDKNKVLERVENSAAGESLPFDLADLTGEWTFREADTTQTQLDLVHSQDLTLTTLSREQALLTTRPTLRRAAADGEDSADGLISQRARTIAGLKMSLNTPAELFNEDDAVAFCDGFGTEAVDAGLRHLLESRVIRMEQKEGRRVPGRNFVYTDEHRRNMEPPLSIADIGQEAHEAHAKLSQQLDSGESAHVGFDNARGDTIALAHMLIEGSVQPIIDTDQLASMRDELMFNAKAVMDHDVEVSIQMQRHEGESSRTAGGGKLDLRARVVGVQLRPATLEEDVEVAWADATKHRPKGVPAKSYTALKDALAAAGQRGVPLYETAALLGDSSTQALRNLCDSNTTRAVLPAFILTSETPERLVHGKFWRDWAVRAVIDQSKSNEEHWFLPQSWLDIHGHTLESEWRACLLSVLSHAIIRPGITIAHLLSLLGATCSRAELKDIVGSLQDTKLVTQKLVLPDLSVVQGMHVDIEKTAHDENVALYAAPDAYLAIGRGTL